MPVKRRGTPEPEGEFEKGVVPEKVVQPMAFKLGRRRFWTEVGDSDIEKLLDEKKRRTEFDAVEGLLSLDRLVGVMDARMPVDWTIYMRLFGGPLTAKTDLMLFLSENGVGGIPVDKISGVETDKLVEDNHWCAVGWDFEKISRERPGIISRLSDGKRLVILEGVYSALFHPSCRWWFHEREGVSNRYAMDIEVECVASHEVRKRRALRRDKNLHKLKSFTDSGPDWFTPFDGRDLVVSTDLMENTGEMERRIGVLQGGLEKGQIDYLKKFRAHSIRMKEFYEK